MRTDRTRVEYRAGQRLAGADLAAQADSSAELLALHQARQHDTWGIAFGFDSTIDGETLRVGPGLGIDASGRDLVQSEARYLSIPPVGTWVVVAAFVENLHRDECALDALPVEAPALRWRRPAEVRYGTEIPIAAIRRSGEGSALNPGVRKRAHSLVRPRIAAGRVQRNSTPVWGTYASWVMAVSTAASGLSSPSPVYLVTLDQHPWGDLANFADTKPPPSEQRLAAWVGPFVAVEWAGPTGFLVRVSGDLGTWRRGDLPEPGTNPVGLSWIGVDAASASVTAYQRLLRLGPLENFFLHGGVL